MNASKRYLAMASSLGMHQGTISPSRRRGGATRCMLPAGPKLGRRAERGGRNGAARLMAELWDGAGGERRTELRGGGAKRGQAELRGTGEVRRGGKRWRVGIPARGSRASPNDELSAPAQRIAAHTAVPPPRQRKASALLAFLCCFVYGSSGPRAFAVTRRLPSGSSSVGGSAFGEIALHVRFANRQCTRRPSRTLAKPSS